MRQQTWHVSMLFCLFKSIMKPFHYYFPSHLGLGVLLSNFSFQKELLRDAENGSSGLWYTFINWLTSEMTAITRIQKVLFLSKGNIILFLVKINWVPAQSLPLPISENFRSYSAFLGISVLVYKMKGHHSDQTHNIMLMWTLNKLMQGKCFA